MFCFLLVSFLISVLRMLAFLFRRQGDVGRKSFDGGEAQVFVAQPAQTMRSQNRVAGGRAGESCRRVYQPAPY